MKMYDNIFFEVDVICEFIGWGGVFCIDLEYELIWDEVF